MKQEKHTQSLSSDSRLITSRYWEWEAAPQQEWRAVALELSRGTDACVLDPTTVNSLSCGRLSEQCGIQITSCAAQSWRARFSTINTLAFGFFITPDGDCQEGIHSPKHSKAKQQALDFRLPSSQPPHCGHKFLALMLLLKEAFCSYNKLEMAVLKRDRVLSFHCVALFSLLQGQNQL